LSDKDKKVVLGVFDDEPKADAAVKALKEWEKTDDRVKMNAIGVLVLDDNGHVKTHKLGSRSVAKGAGIGLILAAVTPVGLVAGVVGGGLLGAMHRKGLGLDEGDRERIGRALRDGSAAVGVLAKADEADLIQDKMKELGGRTEIHPVTDEALEQAALDTMAAQEDAPSSRPQTT
jgi:uncharacterized membrane protein